MQEYLTREEAKETLKERLELFGVTDISDRQMDFALEMTAYSLRSMTNQAGILPRLKYVLADRAAAIILEMEHASGSLDLGAVLGSPALKAVSMGDTRVELADGGQSKEEVLQSLIGILKQSGEEVIRSCRRIRWW